MSVNINNEKVCAFTGHRQVEENFDLFRFEEIVTSYIEEGYTTFLCGMAIGFDMIAAELVLKLKNVFPEIKIIACIPCEGQSRYFNAADKQRYKNILQKCDEVRVLNDRYFRGCMQARDRYMVENSHLVIAYKRVNEGGTYYTMNYALSLNKRI